MGDRRRELPHRRDAVRVRQLHLRLAVAPLALARLGFCSLALGQIEHESDTLVRRFHRRPPRRSARARGCRPSGSIPSRTAGRFRSRCSSARARSLRSLAIRAASDPSSCRRPETRSSRSYPTMRRNASLASRIRPSRSPDADPDDIGVDKAPDLRFAFRQIAVQAGVFQRDRRLRGEQLQHRDPRRREHAAARDCFRDRARR